MNRRRRDSTPGELLDAYRETRFYLALARKQNNLSAADTLTTTTERYERAIGAAVERAGGLDG